MSTSSRKTVSALKQSFEANNNDNPSGPSSPSQHHKQKNQKTSFLANMNAQKKLAKAKQAAQPSIDAILDTATSLAPAKLRPSASKHPSWVGPKQPERPVTPGITRMEYTVTIEFYLPGTQPPVYIATDLSKPQWRPVEMDSTQDEQGEYKYSMNFKAEEGEYQYKLRLGPGDWWICDDSVPKVTDDDGNENNLVVVKPDAEASATGEAQADSPQVPVSEDPERQDSVHPAPLMSHEKATEDHQHLAHKHSQQTLHEPETHSPLFRHESLAPPASDEGNDDDDDDEPESSPLLRHESIAPSSGEQEHSPRFRHESIAIDNQQHHDDARSHSSPRVGGRKHSHDSIPEEADPNDPSLEVFPTDHRGILEHLDRTRKSMQEDETSEGRSEGRNSPRRHSPSGSVIAGTSPSLPSVKEDDDEEEESAAKSEEPDPNADVPQVMISEVQERPFAPMTPPMTPKEDQQNDEQPQLDNATAEDSDDTLVNVREKVENIKNKVHDQAKEAAHSSLPVLAVGLAVAMAAASAALAIWYIKHKSDNMVL